MALQCMSSEENEDGLAPCFIRGILQKMSVLELSDEQVISLVRQLPAERKRTALLALATDAQSQRDERLVFGEAQLRKVCAERGLEWDLLSEDEREAFVNDLLHLK
jgi:hypothetical protein